MKTDLQSLSSIVEKLAQEKQVLVQAMKDAGEKEAALRSMIESGDANVEKLNQDASRMDWTISNKDKTIRLLQHEVAQLRDKLNKEDAGKQQPWPEMLMLWTNKYAAEVKGREKDNEDKDGIINDLKDKLNTYDKIATLVNKGS